MHNDNNNNYHFKIEERRREVASLLAQSMTETDMFFCLKLSQWYTKKDDNNIPKLIAV
jgi:hypothetical protein